MNIMNRFFEYSDQFVLYYLIFENFGFMLLLILSLIEIMYRQWESEIESVEIAPFKDAFIPITILSPAFNEEKSIVSSVRAMLSINYPSHEVIVINDGSKDHTLMKLIENFDLIEIPYSAPVKIKTQKIRKIFKSKTVPNLTVLDKENGGKADALNAGINACRSPLFLSCDADTILSKDALFKLVRPFLTTTNTAACGGTVRIINGSQVEDSKILEVKLPKDALSAIQIVEYMRAFFLARPGWNRLGGDLIISGAFGLFDRDMVIEVGGYDSQTVGEDMELVVRIKRYCYESGKKKILRYVPDPFAWTEGPSDLKTLGKQRSRWYRGLLQVLWKHREMLLNPRYGSSGMISYPFYLFAECLAPIIEFFGLIVIVLGYFMGTINFEFLVIFFALIWGFSLILSLISIFIEQVMFKEYFGIQALKLIGWAIIENLGFRQMSTIWRMRGLISFLRSDKSWGAMERKGFDIKTKS